MFIYVGPMPHLHLPHGSYIHCWFLGVNMWCKFSPNNLRLSALEINVKYRRDNGKKRQRIPMTAIGWKFTEEFLSTNRTFWVAFSKYLKVKCLYSKTRYEFEGVLIHLEVKEYRTKKLTTVSNYSGVGHKVFSQMPLDRGQFFTTGLHFVGTIICSDWFASI